MNLKIKSRSSSTVSDLEKQFSTLPSRLPSELTVAMMRQPLPKPAEFWLALQDEEPVGRIGANVSPVHAGLGYVGFFEVDPKHASAGKIAHALLREAVQWLKSQGCTRIAGPVDYSTWFTYRFIVDKPSTVAGPRRFSWEPLNPPEYPKWFESFGMKEIYAYHSQGYLSGDGPRLLPGAELLETAYKMALSAGFKFRPFDLAQLGTRELPILHQLSHAGFADAYLFEPIPLQVFSLLYATALKRFDITPSCILEAPDGTPVGFNFVFVDGDALVMKTMAVLPQFQKLKLSSALLGYTAKIATERQSKHFVSALVKAGAGSEHHEKRHEKAGARNWRHDYALFGMELT